jgi:hypothetical protein
MEKGQFLKGRNCYAVSLSDGNFILDSGKVISENEGISLDLHITREKKPEIRNILGSMAKIYEQSLSDNKKIEKLMAEIEEIKGKKKENNEKIKKFSFDISVYIEEEKNKVDGKTEVNMSFNTGNLNIPLAIAIVKANKNRPLYYRYGLGYKGAEKQKITKDKAVEILLEGYSLTDFRASGTEILINQYSDNDMW